MKRIISLFFVFIFTLLFCSCGNKFSEKDYAELAVKDMQDSVRDREIPVYYAKDLYLMDVYVEKNKTPVTYAGKNPLDESEQIRFENVIARVIVCTVIEKNEKMYYHEWEKLDKMESCYYIDTEGYVLGHISRIEGEISFVSQYSFENRVIDSTKSQTVEELTFPVGYNYLPDAHFGSEDFSFDV